MSLSVEYFTGSTENFGLIRAGCQVYNTRSPVTGRSDIFSNALLSWPSKTVPTPSIYKGLVRSGKLGTISVDS